jgi:hypothetical protein
VPTAVDGIQGCGFCAALHDERHRLVAESLEAKVAVTVDRVKEGGMGGPATVRKPVAQGTHGAGEWVRGERRPTLRRSASQSVLERRS